MPDDERTRRRLSDATKGRIADLASGWTVDPEPPATPEPDPPPPAPCKKQKTLPPPPPGSEARRALETAILEAAETPVPVAAAPAASTGAIPASGGVPRTKPPTAPPGSPARAATSTSPPGAPHAAPSATPGAGARHAAPSATPGAGARPAGATAPPPPPPARQGAKPTQPPPLPPGARGKPPTKPPPAGAEGSGAIKPAGGVPGGTAGGPYATGPVPTGEFEDAGTLLEKDKLRVAHSQATIKRDASNALLGIAEAPLTVVKETPVEVLLTESAQRLRDDPTSIDPSTQRFERGDPTNMSRPDITLGSTPAPAKAGRLRTVAQLRRQRGVFGDVRYVATAVFGVRHARRELAELEARQTTRQQERRRYMVTLGRTAVISDGFDHPALSAAREQLGGVEDERARHTGQVVAADQELQRVKRDRDAAAKQYVTDLAAVDAELAELGKRLEPLQKEQAAVQRRGAELRESLRRVEKKIAETTSSLVSVKGPKQDPAAIQAELATLKADKVAVQRDEPKIAAELDALNPRIAALESKRTDSQQRRGDLVKAEEDDQRRAEELLAAIGAKRKVMDRAAGDAEALRDKILFELGERLYVDRPDDLGPQLAPIDAVDLEIGEVDRRIMELREILSTIDKAKLWRGIAMIALTVLAVGGFVGWLIYMLA